MRGEGVFRAIVAALAVSALSISAYFRLRAGRTGERFGWREEGLPVFLALRASGLLLWSTILAYLVKPSWIERTRVGLPTWLRWSGAVLGLATVPLVYWVFRSLGGNITPTVALRRAHTLVTHGPYRWVRHPLYTAGMLFAVALFLLTANWLVVLASLTVFGALAVRLPREEANLIARFGDQYRSYMRATGQLFPRLGNPSRKLHPTGRSGATDLPYSQENPPLAQSSVKRPTDRVYSE